MPVGRKILGRTEWKSEYKRAFDHGKGRRAFA